MHAMASVGREWEGLLEARHIMAECAEVIPRENKTDLSCQKRSSSVVLEEEWGGRVRWMGGDISEPDSSPKGSIALPSEIP